MGARNLLGRVELELDDVRYDARGPASGLRHLHLHLHLHVCV